MLQETQHTEFKPKFNEDVIETLVAFANTRGGRVLVGVDDDGKPVKNFTIGKESLQNWANEVKNKTQPQIVPDAYRVGIIMLTPITISVIYRKKKWHDLRINYAKKASSVRFCPIWIYSKN
ncbi:hypothetical protein FACS189413_03070 [Bacteroidia bacterium]|nr:hypothetical protein FACS189413_03070 [Bacteroidia bacterium]